MQYDNLKFLHDELIEYNILDDFAIINIDNEGFNELKEFLSSETMYEEAKFNDDYKLLNQLINVYKNNPKFWET